MRPSFVNFARRIVTRKWYMRVRIWLMASMFHCYESRILDAGPDELARISENLTRYANKEAWYKKRIKN